VTLRSVGFLFISALTPTISAGASLDAVLARMDQNAATFKSASATITQTTHNAALDLDTTDTGTMLLKRPGPHDLRLLVSFTGKDAKSIALQGQKADIYLPKAKTVQEYDLGKNRDLFDQYFLLGLGTSGKDLTSSYDVSLGGPDTVKGQKTTRLQLVPKSKEALTHFRKVDLWVSDDTGNVVQQKLYLPSGDYYLVTYDNLKVNPKISDSALKLNLPKGVQTVYPGK
jgi:outer membrane lipoprotein-sorting protein